MKSSIRNLMLRSLLGLGAAGLVIVSAPASAVAQAAQVRIAVVNPAKVFNEMSETKAMQAKMAEEQKNFEAESRNRAAQVTNMKKGRDDIKPGTPQWNDANNALLEASTEFKIWAEQQRAMAEFRQKQQMKALFDKIQEAISKVAQRDGIDLVIADSSERLPDELDAIDFRTLRSLILQKNVLYVSNKQGLDITSAVLLMLDADYKAGGGAVAAPAAPAAAPVAPK